MRIFLLLLLCSIGLTACGQKESVSVKETNNTGSKTATAEPRQDSSEQAKPQKTNRLASDRVVIKFYRKIAKSVADPVERERFLKSACQHLAKSYRQLARVSFSETNQLGESPCVASLKWAFFNDDYKTVEFKKRGPVKSAEVKGYRTVTLPIKAEAVSSEGLLRSKNDRAVIVTRGKSGWKVATVTSFAVGSENLTPEGAAIREFKLSKSYLKFG